MKVASLIPCLLVTATLASPALADDPSAAAVLMVEDGWWDRRELTEPLGVELYGSFLEQGPYAEIVTVTGRDDATERLAAKIVEVAKRHDLIDVFLSIHTTTRTPEELLALIPPEARKLRLVYSTACYGDVEERTAWIAVGAQTVVSHTGVNNPVVALPYFLSKWLAGVPAAKAASDGFTETERAMSFLSGLPQHEAFGVPEVEGSQPAVTGDAQLTIATGLEGYRPKVSKQFEYDRLRGGPMGLALRALADAQYSVAGEQVLPLLHQLYLPLALPQEARQAVQSIEARIERVRVGLVRRREGVLVLKLAHPVEIPLPGPEALAQVQLPSKLEPVRDQLMSTDLKLTLVLDDEVRLWPGALAPQARLVQVGLSGASIRVESHGKSTAVTPFEFTVHVSEHGGAWLGGAYRINPNPIPGFFLAPLGGERPDEVTGDGAVVRSNEEDQNAGTLNEDQSNMAEVLIGGTKPKQD